MMLDKFKKSINDATNSLKVQAAQFSDSIKETVIEKTAVLTDIIST